MPIGGQYPNSGSMRADVRLVEGRAAFAARHGEPLKAVATRQGVIGILHERGVVTAVRSLADGRWTHLLCRCPSGVERLVCVPEDVAVHVDDLVSVRSLTLPDGSVHPALARLYADGRWIALADVDSLLRAAASPLSGKRILGWAIVATGVAAAFRAALPVGLVVLFLLTAGVVWLAWRRRSDNRRIRALLSAD